MVSYKILIRKEMLFRCRVMLEAAGGLDKGGRFEKLGLLQQKRTCFCEETWVFHVEQM